MDSPPGTRAVLELRGVLSAGVHGVPGTRVGRVAPPHPDWSLWAALRLAVLVAYEAVTAAPLSDQAAAWSSTSADRTRGCDFSARLRQRSAHGPEGLLAFAGMRRDRRHPVILANSIYPDQHQEERGP